MQITKNHSRSKKFSIPISTSKNQFVAKNPSTGKTKQTITAAKSLGPYTFPGELKFI